MSGQYLENDGIGLHLTGNIHMSGCSYINWGGLGTGSSGFGIRDNDGTIQVKANGGSWANMGSTSLSGAIELLAFDQVIISSQGSGSSDPTDGNAVALLMSGGISARCLTATTDLTAAGEVMAQKFEAGQAIQAGTTISGAGALTGQNLAVATTVSGAGEIAGQTLKIGNTTTVDAERSFTGLNITASQALSATSDVGGGNATFRDVDSKTNVSGAGALQGQSLAVATTVSGAGGLTGSALLLGHNGPTIYQSDELGEYGPNQKGKFVTTDSNGNITFQNPSGLYGGEGGVVKFGNDGDTTLAATGSYYGTASFIVSSSHAIRIIMTGALGENNGTSGSFVIQDGDENEYMVFNTKVGNESIYLGKQLIAGFENPGNAISPAQDNDGHTIGASDLRWSDIYAMNVHTGDLHLENHLGSWTVIEDSDFLTLRNNKNGKRFKILMEAIPELDEEV